MFCSYSFVFMIVLKSFPQLPLHSSSFCFHASTFHSILDDYCTDMQDIAGEAGTSSQVMFSNGSRHMAQQKQDDQLERGWGISVLAARHDDDDDAVIRQNHGLELQGPILEILWVRAYIGNNSLTST